MKKGKTYFLLFLLFLSNASALSAQCLPEETEVRIVVKTDAYGYETFWSLVPTGSNCGQQPIASGGNMQQVGCAGGGQEDATTAYGYDNNATVTAGPWCLKTDSLYSVFHVDDYGDGGAEFTIMIGQFPVYTFKSQGDGGQFDFKVEFPLEYNAALQIISTYGYNELKPTEVRGKLFNMGASVINTIDVSYAVNGGPVETETLSSLSVEPFTGETFNFSIPWLPADTGYHNLTMWLSNINGTADLEPGNDTLQKSVYIAAPKPDYLSNYLSDSIFVTNIGIAADGLDKPRDLAFAPRPWPELWVVNQKTEASGGSTVTYFDAGLPTQDPELKKDQNSWHFMSLPTGIAFSYNGNFATSPGVLDANHQGTSAHFTGPALWSSDWSVYAEPSGGNGSHLDMIHQSPYSMGIEWEEDNIFWVYDGYNKNIARYDFREDHGPGNDDHSDGIVHRYTEVAVERLDNNIANHLALDRESGWLYIVDNGNNRVLRMDINSGNISGSLTPYAEPLEEYVKVTGVTWSVYIDSLNKPAGIAVQGDYLLVSDYATGDIIIYDRTGATGLELRRLHTGAVGIMGIEIGPDGRIWYVNTTQNKVNRVDFTPYTVSTQTVGEVARLQVYPNPASETVFVALEHKGTAERWYSLQLINALGQVVYAGMVKTNSTAAIQVAGFAPGQYYIKIQDGHSVHASRISLN